MSETDNSYISSGNNADLVKVIKQYALFLVKKGETFAKPTSENWTPGELKPIGYSSEDGAVIHPEPGDETEIKGHNGDTVYSETDGGYWTIQCAGIECRKSIAEAYFGVEATPRAASTSRTRPRPSNTRSCSRASTSSATRSCSSRRKPRSPTATT